MVKYLVKDSTHNPVKVGDEIKLESLNKTGGGKKTGGSQKPARSKKSLGERITEAVAKALTPVITDIKDIKDRIIGIENDMSDVKGILQRNNLH
jgi:hypothetical protein